jgi:hypothetical protein
MTSRTEFFKVYRDYMTAAARFRKLRKRIGACQAGIFWRPKILYTGQRVAKPVAGTSGGIS